MSNILYHKNTAFGKLYLFFYKIFRGVSAPTRHLLSTFALSIIAMLGVESVRNNHRGFLARATEKSLNAFYHALSYAKADHTRFVKQLVSETLRAIPERLSTHPVFLCVDDTLIEKYGKHFENVSTLFDHASHSGSGYLNGHCFVSLTLSVPVTGPSGKSRFLSCPLAYRMWVKEQPDGTHKSKLDLAAEMIRQAMPAIGDGRTVIVLCDSWYAKATMFSLTKEFKNLDLICNARIDTAMYAPAPERTGKRGRPRLHGDRVSPSDFKLTDRKIGDYYLGHRRVLTNLMKGTVLEAFVTSADKEGGARRLFLSTIPASGLQLFCADYEKAPINQTGSGQFEFLPYMLYSVRWNGTEVGYYEQKTFWGLRKYMLRSRNGIERMLNVINLAYTGMKLLPYIDADLSSFRDASPQEVRSTIGRQIREQVFIASFGKGGEVNINSPLFFKWLDYNSYGKETAA